MAEKCEKLEVEGEAVNRLAGTRSILLPASDRNSRFIWLSRFSILLIRF